jgi:hypothetical protein
MELNVYHDPDNDLLIIETGIPQPSTFKLFDGIGRLVLFKEISDKETLSVKNFEAGIYHYKLVADTRLQVGKLRL